MAQASHSVNAAHAWCSSRFAPGAVSLFTLDLCDACTSLTATFCPRALAKRGLNDDNSLAGAVLCVVCRSSCLAMGRQPCDARLAVSWVQACACCSLQHFRDYHGIAARVSIINRESPATLGLKPCVDAYQKANTQAASTTASDAPVNLANAV